MIAKVSGAQVQASFTQPARVLTFKPRGADDTTVVADGFGKTDPLANLGGPVDYHAVAMGILKDYEYGPDGLKQAHKKLAEQGIYVQQASDGGYRGRLVFPDGHKFDVCGVGETMDWWNDKKGSCWGWTDQGYDSAAYPGGAPGFSFGEGILGLGYSNGLKGYADKERWKALVSRAA